MGLRDLYTLSETIRDKINNDDLPEEILKWKSKWFSSQPFSMVLIKNFII